MNFLKSTTFALLAGTILFGTSCKKEEPEAQDEKIGGCLDTDSPGYNSNADFDDQSCQYAYVSAYEISYHPSQDGGSDWDFLANTDADLILRVKEQGATNWMFESSVIDNVGHTTPATWTAPTNIKLLNKNYEWELYDSDGTSGDDFVSSGVFNPIDLASNGSVITIGTNSDNNDSQLKLTYVLGE